MDVLRQLKTLVCVLCLHVDTVCNVMNQQLLGTKLVYTYSPIRADRKM